MHCSFSRKIPKHVCSHTAGCRESAPTRLLPASTRLRRRVCPDASAPTRPRRRVHAEASAPTRLLRPVRAEPSSPTRQFRGVCADASAPTRLHRRVCADASALARQNTDFRSKTLIPLETSSKNSKKHQAKSPLLQKMITPIAVAEFPR